MCIQNRLKILYILMTFHKMNILVFPHSISGNKTWPEIQCLPLPFLSITPPQSNCYHDYFHQKEVFSLYFLNGMSYHYMYFPMFGIFHPVLCVYAIYTIKSFSNKNIFSSFFIVLITFIFLDLLHYLRASV